MFLQCIQGFSDCNLQFVKLDYLSVSTAMAQMQCLCVLDMREAFHFIVVNPLLTL